MNRQNTHRVVGVADAGKLEFAREQRKQPSPGEQRLWQALRNRGIGVRFRRQHPIQNYVLDFYCAEAKLALEVDGSGHEEQRGYDRNRDEDLASWGIRTIRFEHTQVMGDLQEVLRKIRAELGLTPRPPLLSGEGENDKR
jgi:very-short-patch-repair endonuclease